MFLRYGPYTHAQNEPAVQIGKRAIFSPRGLRQSVRETWRIVGVLHAASQPALTAAIAGLRSAYSVNGYDLGLYLHDQTTLTDHGMTSADPLGGTERRRLVFANRSGRVT